LVGWDDKRRKASSSIVARIVNINKVHVQMSDQKPTKSQLDKFKDAARKLGADESEERFDETLRRISKAKPPKGDQKRQSK